MHSLRRLLGRVSKRPDDRNHGVPPQTLGRQGGLDRLTTILASAGMEELSVLGGVHMQLTAIGGIDDQERIKRRLATQLRHDGTWQALRVEIRHAMIEARRAASVALDSASMAASDELVHHVLDAASDLGAYAVMYDRLGVDERHELTAPYTRLWGDLGAVMPGLAEDGSNPRIPEWQDERELDWDRYPAGRRALDDLAALNSALDDFDELSSDTLVGLRSSEEARLGAAMDDHLKGSTDLHTMVEAMCRFEVFRWLLAGERPVEPLDLQSVLELRLRHLDRDRAAGRVDDTSGESHRELAEALAEIATDEGRRPKNGANPSGRHRHRGQSGMGPRGEEPDGMLTSGPQTSESRGAGASDATPLGYRWVATESMLEAHHFHTATLLPDGSVLVVGGAGGSGTEPEPLRSAELYDARTGSWTATGSMRTARTAHATARLHDGTVLVAGGNTDTSDLASAEVYDPNSGAWAVTGTMFAARAVHTATLLNDGKVLIAGGADSMRPSASKASAELYDPASQSWIATGSMVTPRQRHSATLLADGRVLVAGGANSRGALASSEVYDPKIGSWDAVGDMEDVRVIHTATLLPDGMVLVAGGSTGRGGALASAELYDPDSRSWSAIRNLNGAHSGHTATLLPDGRVLIAGGASLPGRPLDTVELYDPNLVAWTATDELLTARAVHTATLLPDGKILVAGGGNVHALASAELYDPGIGQ